MFTRVTLPVLLLGFSLFHFHTHDSLAAKAKATPSPSPTPAASATVPPKPSKPIVDQTAQVIIFGYHRFVNKVRHPDTEITPEDFEKQMQELKDKGIAVIGLQDLLAWKRSEKSRQGK